MAAAFATRFFVTTFWGALVTTATDFRLFELFLEAALDVLETEHISTKVNRDTPNRDS
jgi:hypothetical protein